MRIMHLSDLHLGKRLNNFSLLEDQVYIHQQIVQIAIENNVEAVIIAGDVFDKSIPSSGAVQLFDEMLNDWAKLNLPVLIISGNHDSAERLSFGHDIFKHRQIYISPVYQGKISCVTLNDTAGKINFYLLPFIKPATVRPFFPDVQIDSYNDAVKTALSSVELNRSERNILIAHQFVTGASLSDSEEIIVGGLDNINADLFEAFDYVALGHIHTPQKILHDTIRYCGTPLKYSFSEANQEKSVTIIDFPEKHKITLKIVPLKPLHDMRKLRGTYDELVKRDNYLNTHTDDYLAVTLTDEEEIPEAIARLRAIYPNIMQLNYDNKRTQTNQVIETSDINKLKTPLELFNDFYKLQNNQELNETQRQIMVKLIQDIWEAKQ